MGRTSSVTVSLCSGFPGFSAAAWEAASRPQLLRSALQLLQVCQNWPPSLLELKF